jgi:heme oxygenase
VRVARLIDRVHEATAAFHGAVDAALVSRRVTARAYQRHLARTYGYVAPVERSITTTPDIERFVDVRRFHKEELLRRDLVALQYTTRAIDALPQCSIPLFSTAPEALGWAYFLERSTRSNNATYRALATAIPGEIAFASSYIKCYFGAVGEMWTAFESALDLVPEPDAKIVIEAALAAFRAYDRWNRTSRSATSNTSGSMRMMESDFGRGDDETNP